MRVVFSTLQNYPGFSDDDFKEDGSAFQRVGPETAKAREGFNIPKIIKIGLIFESVTVLVRGK